MFSGGGCRVDDFNFSYEKASKDEWGCVAGNGNIWLKYRLWEHLEQNYLLYGKVYKDGKFWLAEVPILDAMTSVWRFSCKLTISDKIDNIQEEVYSETERRAWDTSGWLESEGGRLIRIPDPRSCWRSPV